MNHHFSEVIKIALQTLKISAYQLAPLIGVNYNTLYKWLKQEYIPPYGHRLIYVERLKLLIRDV